MPDLASFQRQFAHALMMDEQPSSSFRSQAFAVYRNTSARGAVEALRASYRTVDLLVGEEMFTQAALDYRSEQPPANPVLSDYGHGFSAFLARQPWTCELPYLADVAKLDWLWLESFLAAEAPNNAERPIGGATVALHPATRFAWLPTPAMTIWLAHRDPWDMSELEIEWTEEGALFTRPGQSVCAELIDADFHRLLLDCAVPAPVADIVARMTELCPDAKVPELLQRGVESGALIIN